MLTDDRVFYMGRQRFTLRQDVKAALIYQAKTRGMNLGQIMSAILTNVVDDGLVAATLEDV